MQQTPSNRFSRREFLRLSALTGASLTAAGYLAGCVAPTAAPAAPAASSGATSGAAYPPGTKLAMKLRASFIPQSNDILSATIKAWGEANGVETEVDIVSMNDLQTIAATAAETGAGPDIIELNQASAHLFAEELVDLTDVADDLGDRYGGWYDAAVEGCKVGESWMGLPRFFAAHAINYRPDITAQVGMTDVPDTWEGILEVGRELKTAGLPPIAFPLGRAVGDGNDFVYSVLWSYGASDVGEDGTTVTIDSPETRDALTFMKALFDEAMPPDVLSYDDASNNRAFNAGAISMTNNAASIYANAVNQGILVQVDGADVRLADVMDHFEYPGGPAGRRTYAEFMAQAVFSYSPNQEAAKALLTFLNEEGQLGPWAAPAYSFIFPALRQYKDAPLMPWNTNPKLEPFKNYAEDSHLPGYPSTNFRGGTEAYAKWLVMDMFANYASGAKEMEDVIAETAEQLQSIYGA